MPRLDGNSLNVWTSTADAVSASQANSRHCTSYQLESHEQTTTSPTFSQHLLVWANFRLTEEPWEQWKDSCKILSSQHLYFTCYRIMIESRMIPLRPLLTSKPWLRPHLLSQQRLFHFRAPPTVFSHRLACTENLFLDLIPLLTTSFQKKLKSIFY